MATYPGGIVTLTNPAGTDNVAGSHAALHSSENDEIEAIETELGITPSGSFVDVAARLNARLTCRKTADQTFNSTTRTNVTDLVLPINSTGVDYWFKFEYAWNAGAVGVVLVPSLTFPTVAGTLTILWETIGLSAASGTTSVANMSAHVTTGTASPQSMGFPTSTTVPAAGARQWTRITGILSNPSATGSLQLQQNLETGTTAATLLRGGWGEMYIA